MSKMRLTRSGGFLIVLSCEILFWSMELSASNASSIAGCASLRSSSASIFLASISLALATTPSTMTATRAFSFSATAVDAEISFRSFSEDF